MTPIEFIPQISENARLPEAINMFTDLIQMIAPKMILEVSTYTTDRPIKEKLFTRKAVQTFVRFPELRSMVGKANTADFEQNPFKTMRIAPSSGLGKNKYLYRQATVAEIICIDLYLQQCYQLNGEIIDIYGEIMRVRRDTSLVASLQKSVLSRLNEILISLWEEEI